MTLSHTQSPFQVESIGDPTDSERHARIDLKRHNVTIIRPANDNLNFQKYTVHSEDKHPNSTYTHTKYQNKNNL